MIGVPQASPLSQAIQGPMNAYWNYAGLMGQQMSPMLDNAQSLINQTSKDYMQGNLSPTLQSAMDYGQQNAWNKMTNAYNNPYNSGIGEDIGNAFAGISAQAGLQDSQNQMNFLGSMLPNMLGLTNQGFLSGLSGASQLPLQAMQQSVAGFYSPMQALTQFFGTAPYNTPVYSV